jgi:hypothetical protein
LTHENVEPFLKEVSTFLEDAWAAGAWAEAERDRVLATVLSTDVVCSSEKPAALGDRAWRELLQRDTGECELLDRKLGDRRPHRRPRCR